MNYNIQKSIVIRLVVLLLLLACPAIAQTSELIEMVELKGTTSNLKNTYRQHIKTTEGDQYSSKQAVDDLKSLLSKGEYDEYLSSVSVTQGRNGKIVTFYIMDRPTISELTYKGISPSEESEITSYFESENVKIKVGEIYSPNELSKAYAALKEFFDKLGRKNVLTQGHVEYSKDKSKVSIRIEIMEKPPRSTEKRDH